MWEWDEEYEDLSRTKPKYSTILQEEEYESEGEGEEPQGFDRGPERSQVETWDPWQPSYFFPIR
jgi:hypothetical protein